MIRLLTLLVLAPFIALGMVMEVATLRITPSEVWIWMGDNEPFCLVMVTYLVVAALALESLV